MKSITEKELQIIKKVNYFSLTENFYNIIKDDLTRI